MLDKIHRGYIEGYYGKLLSFEDRHKLLVCLENLSMDSYLYAPKEDICHRFDWRRPYRESWLSTFASFLCRRTGTANSGIGRNCPRA